MNIVRTAVFNPVGVIVTILLMILFGSMSLSRLPVQLTPEIEKPEITISTVWRASSPEEVEAEIIEPQEKVLRSVPGMTRMLSKAKQGRSEITLTFSLDVELQRALLEVINRLNRVARYPDDADEPVISAVGGDSNPIAWFILEKVAGNNRDIASYEDFFEEVVKARFERVPGVARSELRGGRQYEIQVLFDAYKAALYEIDLPQVMSLAGTGKNISAGWKDVGKRKYTIRYSGVYDVGQLKNMILKWYQGAAIRLGDIAVIEKKLVDRTGFVITNGQVAMAANVRREIGVNVLEVMAGLKKAAKELDAGPLKEAGIKIRQVYDETLYIDRSIQMLLNNLMLGIGLAVIVLWWFLRQMRATLIVALAIPVSIITAFVVLKITGRSINVISLAGLAFAVGMVLDAAIVVLENIVRLRQKKVAEDVAAINGVYQVLGALIASTATTVAIFLPVVFLKEEAGQLFADLAVTISASIVLSLIVAVTILPSLTRLLIKPGSIKDPHQHWWKHGARVIIKLTHTPLKRFVWAVMLMVGAIYLTIQLVPKADYLPTGNRNLVFAFVLPPPGMNVDTLEKEMGATINERIKPYLEGTKLPQIKHYFFVVLDAGVFIGARAVVPDQAGELVKVMNQVIQGFPDSLAFAKRASLFGGINSGRTIDIDIQSQDMDVLVNAALMGFIQVNKTFAGSAVRPQPGLALAEPELRLIPNERRLTEAGWNRFQLGNIIRALGDGLFVGEYFDGEKKLNVIVRSHQWKTPEALLGIPLFTPKQGVIPLAELVTLKRTAGPQEIRRINRNRSITLQLTPPDNMPMEDAIQILKTEVEPVIRLHLSESGHIQYTGVADKLKIALASMIETFLLAIVILYLLMSALFKSFKDSLLVLMTLPLATVGGISALKIMNIYVFQPLDLLTMIGFIILLGLVVNNAILLVHQTRHAERGGVKRQIAVYMAVKTRLRPILMTTLTSVCGMLPLLLNPGAGSELYRGMAGVIVGGMCLSTVFTLILLPSLLQMGKQQ